MNYRAQRARTTDAPENYITKKSPRNTIQLLLLAAAFGAGCAQMPDTHVMGDASSMWPTPTISQAEPPMPPEPTVLPQATVPEKATAPTHVEEPRRASAPRRAAATPAPAPSASRATAPKTATANAPRDVWQRIRNGFQMTAFDHSLVDDWENYYASRGDYFARMIDNASHFLYHVVTQVERRGMPMEIALLPMIESAFNPVAYSHAHASGIWQFIPSTGKNYGLKQNWWYDGRRDVIAATSAALDYLQTLYGMFNDWELALAAYNWGEGAVQRAVDRNRARGMPTDYRSLSNMPAETRNYVPKLIAVKNIIANPARFGLTLAHVPNEPYFEVVTVQRHIDVARAAQFAEMSLEEFRFLNPAHNKRVINTNSAETIVLPKHKVAAFRANMSRHDDKPLVSMKTHNVRAGERPETIAAQYNISVAELNQLNGIGPRRRITTGQTLIVPNHTDLHPALDEVQNAAMAAEAATRPLPVHTQHFMRKVVVTRGGVRRTLMVPVQAPARQANVRAVPMQRLAVRNAGTNAGARGQPAKATAKPGLQKVVYQTAPAKPKRR